MRAELRGRHDLGEIIGLSYRLYGRNFVPFVMLAAITIPLQLLIGVVQQSSDGEGAQIAAGLLNIPAALVGLIASAALIVAVHEATGGMAPEFGRALDGAFERFGALVRTSLLAGVLALLALAAAPALAVYWIFNRQATIDGKRLWWLAIVPGALTIYLVVRWVLIQQSVMIENGRTWSALDESAIITRGNWWRVLGILIVIGLIELGPVGIAGAVAFALPPLVSSAITSIVFAIVIPFPVAAQTLLYYDLKARKQADADASADRLPATEPDQPG